MRAAATGSAMAFPCGPCFRTRLTVQRSARFCCWTVRVPRISRRPTNRVASKGHPHKGFETVTIVYSGEVEHRDSTGGGGLIGQGDVQWMTAASGLVHEEMHGRDFMKRGGTLQMIQLWVNLPAKDKKGPPHYRASPRADPGRAIAGQCGPRAHHRRSVQRCGGPGPHIHADQPLGCPAKFRPCGGAGRASRTRYFVFVLSGQIELASGETVNEAGLAILDPQATRLP